MDESMKKVKSKYIHEKVHGFQMAFQNNAKKN